MPDVAPPLPKPTTRRWLRILAITLPIVLIIGAIATIQGREWYRERLEDRDYERAQRCLGEGKRSEAAFITAGRLSHIVGGSGARSERALRWYRLDIACALKTGNVAHLAQLYERVPELVEADEDASARVAILMLVYKEFERFAALREHWRGHEQKPSWWLGVDTEALLRQGKPDEALAFLEGQKLAGRDDAVRLLHLALLRAPKNPSLALTLLDQAYQVDPRNADVRTQRAVICEHAGDLGRARAELSAAQAVDPANPIHSDFLAEFFHRQHDTVEMVKTLEAGQQLFQLESYRLKLDFWARAAYPGGNRRDEADPGELKPLLAFVEALPAGTFWDEARFLALPGADGFGRKQQEIWWLRLLQFLKDGRDEDALHHLEANQFHERGWERELESALGQTLALRLRGDRTPPRHGLDPQTAAAPSRAAVLRDLDRLSASVIDPSLGATIAVLKGPYGFAALCFAVGWNEAGLVLMPDFAPLASDAPSWLANSVTAALRWNRSFDQALAYADIQPPTAQLGIQQAELLIALKHPEQAIARLTPLSADPEFGMLATWMLATLALEARDADRAEALIAGNEAFAATLRGRELLARATVVRGHDDDADRLYGAIAEQSGEGALWMLHRARQRKDDDAIRTWTAALVRLQPDLADPSARAIPAQR